MLAWYPLQSRCAPFGSVLDIEAQQSRVAGRPTKIDALLDALETDGGAALRHQLGAAHGLLLFRGIPKAQAQAALLRLAGLVGSATDDYGLLGAGSGRGNVLRLSEELPTEITTVELSGNLSREEVLPPDTLTYPARYGWHTDQSFREQPSDLSLFYCVTPAGDGLATTCFADGVAAYASLPPDQREAMRQVNLLHAGALTGRWEPEILGHVALAESSGGIDGSRLAAASATPSAVRRLVRRHPETVKRKKNDLTR